MEDSSQVELEQTLMNVRLLLANVENFKYVEANAPYLEKEDIINTLSLAIQTIEPTLKAAQMRLELELLLRDPNVN